MLTTVGRVLARTRCTQATAGITQATERRAFHIQRALQAIVPYKLTDIGEGIAEAEILQWFVQEGDEVKQFDSLCEVQSDKATVEISSKFNGVIRKLHYDVSDMAATGKPLVDIEIADEDAPVGTAVVTPDAPVATPAAAAAAPAASSSGKVLATPAVRRIARENNIDLSLVVATGNKGHVLKSDVMDFMAGKQTATTTTTTTTAPTGSSVAYPVAEDRTEKVGGMMRTMIKTMEAANQVPHFGYNDEIYMNSLVDVRSALKPVAEKAGVKLSFMPFFIKAASMALKSYPVLNSSLSSDKQQLTYKARHNIGFAMDTPVGLMVPNVKDVQHKSILEVASDMNRIIAAGSEGKLSPDDLKDGTFTLSNIGAVGGTYASPVVFLPEVAIGALGKTQKLPRFDAAGNVYAAHVMNVSWAADHRVIDGATMARFSNEWKAMLEDPASMLLSLK